MIELTFEGIASKWQFDDFSFVGSESRWNGALSVLGNSQ